jgi:uncharacterized SAM-binding protein YcdF (DUF218 family)
LFSGGAQVSEAGGIPESVYLHNEAIKFGVPTDSILLETQSRHTKENVLKSLAVLDRAIGLQNISTLLAVSIPWHMRRCTLMLKTFMPPRYNFIWCPCQREFGQRDNWHEDPSEKRGQTTKLSLAPSVFSGTAVFAARYGIINRNSN